jgi:zinc transporter 1/2/3
MLFKRQDLELPVNECSISITDYDLNFHIWAIFIVLGGSLVGCLLPKLITVKTSIFRLLGCGIILATGYIHMLTPAQELFLDPCFPTWFPSYSGWSGVFALFGLLLAHALQTITAEHVSEKSLPFSSPLATAITLEFGTAVHSVLIGVALGVATDEFIPLLVAITFHQFFEGLALSSIITEVGFQHLGTVLAFLGLYVVSTPVGVGIGIGIREALATDTGSSILVQAILDAICGGILVYNGLVNILAPHFNNVFYSQSVLKRMVDVSLIWVGCLIMAIIGIWA